MKITRDSSHQPIEDSYQQPINNFSKQHIGELLRHMDEPPNHTIGGNIGNFSTPCSRNITHLIFPNRFQVVVFKI
jgi:hypothetical protein